MEKRKLYDEEDDDIIIFLFTRIRLCEDEEDCDEDNNLQHENNRENNLTELVKEKRIIIKQKISTQTVQKKSASMICDLFELHTAAEEYVYLLSLDTKQDSWHI